MQKIKKDVKSKGTVVDSIVVTQYDTVAEAVKLLTEKKCLDMINKVISDTASNMARTAKVRPTSPMALLNKLAKDDPKVEAQIQAILKKAQAEAATGK